MMSQAELDATVHSLARAREHIRQEWLRGLYGITDVVWEDDAFFAANECLTEAIVAVIHAKETL